jgi:hypothetical protein
MAFSVRSKPSCIMSPTRYDVSTHTMVQSMRLPLSAQMVNAGAVCVIPA